jgi:hypothetical protein
MIKNHESGNDVLAGPWELGWRDRGMGHGDYGVMDDKGNLICLDIPKEIAQHIIDLHNVSLKKQPIVDKLVDDIVRSVVHDLHEGYVPGTPKIELQDIEACRQHLIEIIKPLVLSYEKKK